MTDAALRMTPRNSSEFEVGFFENPCGAVQEAVAQDAVDDAMVVRQRQVHHGADRERVGAVNLDHPRPLLHLAHPQDSDLRLIDNREAVEIALAPWIREREASAG